MGVLTTRQFAAQRGPEAVERVEAIAAQTPDSAKAEVLHVQAASYGATAAKFAKVDAAYLLAKYLRAEKIIVIKLGDVRVGYGPAPTS